MYVNKLSNVVKYDVVKKDASNAQIKDSEDEIPDVANLATNTTPKAKINEFKNEIPSITNLATTAALNAKINEVKNKIPNITKLINNIALTTVENKISDQSKYITTQEFNKLTAENYIGRFKQANLLSKNYISALVKDFDDKLKKN